MIYDVLAEHAELQERYQRHNKTDQALRHHEAKLEEHLELWQAVQIWTQRHRAQLISELPGLLLDSLHGGDLSAARYSHVIVDEFQDLTPGEQELFLRLKQPAGQFIALGDPRQSIYAFRGNDKDGLAKLESFQYPGSPPILDLPMTECQRCPAAIVDAANRLMALSPAHRMVSVSLATANLHTVYWDLPSNEARGMARAIVENITSHSSDLHLVMVTRRQFGYSLRNEIATLDGDINVDLSFSESLLETWAVREAFLYFCLLVDPDAPTWRSWLGYCNDTTGRRYKTGAPKRNADAYLKFLASTNDDINADAARQMVSQPKHHQDKGG
jgi:superfamily I DNA/RNA helicase